MKFIKLIAFTVLFSGGVFAQQSIEAKAQEQTSEMAQLLSLDAAQKNRVYIYGNTTRSVRTISIIAVNRAF